MISPEGLGRLSKPFVFLDFLEAANSTGFGFGFHPHLGIATLTYHTLGDIEYEDTTGAKGTLRATGVEWMRAGSGTWHRGQVVSNGPLQGFQLWIALEPPLEVGSSEGLYVPPEAIPEWKDDGVIVRLLLGSWGSRKSIIAPPSAIDLFHVSMPFGGFWRYTPPQPDMTIAWLMVNRGEVFVDGERISGELAVLEETTHLVEVEALGSAAFMFGAARRHPYHLVLGPSSVHSSEENLAIGQAGIAAVADQLRRAGRMDQ